MRCLSVEEAILLTKCIPRVRANVAECMRDSINDYEANITAVLAEHGYINIGPHPYIENSTMHTTTKLGLEALRVYNNIKQFL